jgi:fructose-specific phosphotransferase system IIA component
MARRRAAPFAAILMLIPSSVSASVGSEHSVVNLMANLVLQIGVILFVARVGGIVFARLKMPSVIGELLAGVCIGPYLLGGIALPGFPGGLFAVAPDAALGISPELYGFATVASVVLLFYAGLETDLSMFLRFSLTGSLVGAGGVLFSMVIGAVSCAMLLDIALTDPRALFLGVISTATSVGITARILSEKRKIDSPSGVTILAGAIIDDVLGIILLAVILGAVTVVREGAAQSPGWQTVGMIVFKAIGVWLGFSALGFILAHRISAFLKTFKSITTFSVLSLGMALILAGIFEKAGLAMIIGAYVMGLTLSKTDLAYVIQDALHPIYAFLVPVFFVVMGMLVNVNELLSAPVLIVGGVYTAGAILAKLIGCGLPALFFNFNALGALRIGLGMVPRGEVALIVAGIGLASGLLDHQTFGIAILMTMVTTLIAPPFLSAVLNERKGVRKDIITEESVSTDFDFDSPELTALLEAKLLEYFRNEGFFVHSMEADGTICHLRKDSMFIRLYIQQRSMRFETRPEEVTYVKTIVYEALLNLHVVVNKLKNIAKPASLKKDLAAPATAAATFSVGAALHAETIIMDLTAETKDEVIDELLHVLHKHGYITDKQRAREAVMERERTMSTGMQDGIAIPHGKTDSVGEMAVAVGLKRKGIDFQSLDGKPSYIFILALSPESVTGPHLQFLAGVSSLLNSEESRDRLLSCRTQKEVFAFFGGKSGPRRRRLRAFGPR